MDDIKKKKYILKIMMACDLFFRYVFIVKPIVENVDFRVTAHPVNIKISNDNERKTKEEDEGGRRGRTRIFTAF